MKKVCVIGHFGFGFDCANGQTIKTKTVTKIFEDAFGTDQVDKIDTYGGVKTLLKLPFLICKELRRTKNVVILPAHNGVRVVSPILIILNKFYGRKLHYSVIGGWLPEFVKHKPLLKRCLKKFDNIFVETRSMKTALDSQGFTNVSVVPNCKELKILKPEDLVYSVAEPLKLCTFSRVCKNKGIEEAVNAVREVNEVLGRTVYCLDIYGPVEKVEENWFNNLRNSFPLYVKYRGVVPYGESVGVLKKYYALLFPTEFYTEGVPGTIIDAYAAGLPVIASKWESWKDVIDSDKVGIVYDFNNHDELKKMLFAIAAEPGRLDKMRRECLTKAQDFTVQRALDIMGGGWLSLTVEYSDRKLLINISCEAERTVKSKRLKFCTFSRVIKSKGIEEAVKAVESVHHKLGDIVELDIYGQIDEVEKEWFCTLSLSFPEYIRYKGVVPFGQSIHVLKDYYALLFPTYYPGEGFAGTIIDAFASGVPVIASDWRYNRDIIRDGETGHIVKTGSIEALSEAITDSILNYEKWNDMKANILEEAEKYTIENVSSELFSRIEGD